MGIVNVTPDSFSDGGVALDPRVALDSVRAMAAAGAAICDVGAESTRPGAEPVPEDEEIARMRPVLEALADDGGAVPLSVDTRRASVAALAIDAGAVLVNDVTAGADPAMFPLVAGRGVGICLMHMQGEPQQMQVDPHYQDVVAEVHGFLQKQLGLLEALGIARERILLDPGFGFGKTLAHNRALFEALPSLCSEQHVLVGVSRKRMIGQLSSREDSPAHERLGGSLAAAVLAAQAGASVIRVHDVRETVDALRVWNRLTHQTSESMTGTSTSTPTTVARAAPE
jgi:dihydropteroate synthase